MVEFLQFVFGTDRIALLGLMIALLSLLAIYRKHRSDDNPYRFSDLYTTGNHMDLDKVGKLTALAVTTWLVIHMELREYTTEWMVVLYLTVCMGAAFGSLMARIKRGPAQSSSTVETTTVAKSTEVISVPPAAAPIASAAGPLPRPPIT